MEQRRNQLSDYNGPWGDTIQEEELGDSVFALVLKKFDRILNEMLDELIACITEQFRHLAGPYLEQSYALCEFELSF